MISGLGVLGSMRPHLLPLCFSPDTHVVCPTHETTWPNPAAAQTDKAIEQTVSGWDIWLVEAIGLVAAALASAFALRGIRGTSTPYSLPVALSVLKLSTGALTAVLGSSPFLTEILIRDPEYFHWLVPQIERSAPDWQDLEEEVSTLLAHVHEPDEALDTLKRWKRREILRIATRDLLRRETVPSTTSQLSDVEDVDLPKAIMEMQLQQTSYQAALAATAKVIQPSLIDFLR